MGIADLERTQGGVPQGMRAEELGPSDYPGRSKVAAAYCSGERQYSRVGENHIVLFKEK